MFFTAPMTPKKMSHSMAVNRRKSAPSSFPTPGGKSTMRNVSTTGKYPRIGMLWPMSKSGTSTRSAVLVLGRQDPEREAYAERDEVDDGDSPQREQRVERDLDDDRLCDEAGSQDERRDEDGDSRDDS